MNRSQVSLIFNDDKLYTEFVKPLSQERKLMPLIVKLLSSYYYNAGTREEVDGTSIEIQMQNSEFVSDDTRVLQEKLADIRASAQLLGMFVQDSKATLEEGLEAVNGIAKATGGTVSRQTDVGMTVPRISVKGIDSLHSEVEEAKKAIEEHEAVASEPAPAVVQYHDERVDSLQKDVAEMKTGLSQILSVVEGFNSMKDDIIRISSMMSATQTVAPSVVEKVEVTPKVGEALTETVVSEEKITDLPVSAPAELDKTFEVHAEEPIKHEVASESVEEKHESTPEETENGKNMLKGMLLGGGVGGFF